MEIGRKQLAVLLLLSKYDALSVKEIQRELRDDSYKAVAATLSKLVEKGYLVTHERGKKLVYELTESVIYEHFKPFEDLMSCACNSNEMIRALYA